MINACNDIFNRKILNIIDTLNHTHFYIVIFKILIILTTIMCLNFHKCDTSGLGSMTGRKIS